MIGNDAFSLTPPSSQTWETLKHFSRGKSVKVEKGELTPAALLGKSAFSNLTSNQALQTETSIIKGVLNKANEDLNRGFNHLTALREKYYNKLIKSSSGLESLRSDENEIKGVIESIKNFKKEASAVVRGTDAFIAAYRNQFDNPKMPQNKASQAELDQVIGNPKGASGLKSLIEKCDAEIHLLEEMLSTSSALAKLVSQKGDQNLIDKEVLNSGTYKDLKSAYIQINKSIENRYVIHLSSQQVEDYVKFSNDLAKKMNDKEMQIRRLIPPTLGNKDHVEGEVKHSGSFSSVAPSGSALPAPPLSIRLPGPVSAPPPPSVSRPPAPDSPILKNMPPSAPLFKNSPPAIASKQSVPPVSMHVPAAPPLSPEEPEDFLRAPPAPGEPGAEEFLAAASGSASESAAPPPAPPLPKRDAPAFLKDIKTPPKLNKAPAPQPKPQSALDQRLRQQREVVGSDSEPDSDSEFGHVRSDLKPSVPAPSAPVKPSKQSFVASSRPAVALHIKTQKEIKEEIAVLEQNCTELEKKITHMPINTKEQQTNKDKEKIRLVAMQTNLSGLKSQVTEIRDEKEWDE